MSDLSGFERASYRRDPDRGARFVQALFKLTTQTLKDTPDAKGPLASDSPAVIARFVSATAALFADPAFRLTPAEAERCWVLKSTLDNLFLANPMQSADVVLAAITDGTESEGLDTAELRLLLQSIDSRFEVPLQRLLELPPATAQMAMSALLATKPVATLQGQERRDRLLEMATAFPPASLALDADQLVMVTGAWMLCSYAGTPDKHAVKPLLNRTLRDMAERMGLTDAPPKTRKPLVDRPVMVVAAEIMNSQHVQYRYFGQYLRQLRARFELVLVTETKEADPVASALFDRVLTFERRPGIQHLPEIHALITGADPDIVFYPSVGMRHWGPLMANLRLAPIQFTGLGHSASTFCPTIDYYLVEEGYVSDPALIGEVAMLMPDESLVFERAPHYTPVAPTIREQANPLRIAAPSNLLKLNPRFLQTLALIKSAARRPLEFHFFPGSSGLELIAARNAIAQFLPDARVHENQRYDRYLQMLSACDLNLSPFPFGGLHSVVDSLRQGLPVVAMECPEMHGRTDAMLLRRLGMPDWLVATDEGSYVAAALRLIADDATRVAVSRQALGLDIDKLLFGDATTPLRTEVVDAVSWLYENHEAVMASGRRAWTQRDRQREPHLAAPT